MKIKQVIFFGLLSCLGFSVVSQAAEIEVSLGGGFHRSSYSAGNFAWSRRWSASFGYQVSGISEIEFAFQDVLDRTKIDGYQDTTFHDEIYSANWVQAFWGRQLPFQPFVKAGMGQLNRTASGTYAGGGTPPIIFDRLTGILGAGFRFRIVQGMGIRCEATTYLPGANISTWRDNVAVTAGLSFMF